MDFVGGAPGLIAQADYSQGVCYTERNVALCLNDSRASFLLCFIVFILPCLRIQLQRLAYYFAFGITSSERAIFALNRSTARGRSTRVKTLRYPLRSMRAVGKNSAF